MGAPCLLDPTHRNRVHWLSHLPGRSRISLAAPNQMERVLLCVRCSLPPARLSR